MKVYKQTFPIEKEGELNRLKYDMQNDEQNVAQALADISETTIAKTSHAVGDYIVLDGIFCEVIAFICKGETILKDRNVKAVSVGSVLSALKR